MCRPLHKPLEGQQVTKLHRPGLLSNTVATSYLHLNKIRNSIAQLHFHISHFSAQYLYVTSSSADTEHSSTTVFCRAVLVQWAEQTPNVFKNVLS